MCFTENLEYTTYGLDGDSIGGLLHVSPGLQDKCLLVSNYYRI